MSKKEPGSNRDRGYASYNVDDERISLEERFKEYNGENLTKEFVWDDPSGKEIW